MTRTEVDLAIGQPKTKKTWKNRDQWLYGHICVYFTNGLVSSVETFD